MEPPSDQNSNVSPPLSAPETSGYIFTELLKAI